MFHILRQDYDYDYDDDVRREQFVLQYIVLYRMINLAQLDGWTCARIMMMMMMMYKGNELYRNTLYYTG